MKKLLFITFFLISGICSGQGNFFMWHIPANQTPSVVTYPYLTVTSTSFIASGEVINDNGLAVTERGIQMGTFPNETTITAGTGEGSFTAEFTGLAPDHSYTYRAYACNSAGCVYGDDYIVTTTIDPITAATIGSIYGGGVIYYIEDFPTTRRLHIGGNVMTSYTIRWETAKFTARDYRGGGFTDWYLPSVAEAELVRSFQHGFNFVTLLDIPVGIYWCMNNYRPFPWVFWYAATLDFNSYVSYEYHEIDQNYMAFPIRIVTVNK